MDYAVIRDTPQVEIHEQSNFLGRMTDLHTGEHTGRVWPWVIDLVAVFLGFASFSGLILWITLPKRRRIGIMALGRAWCCARGFTGGWCREVRYGGQEAFFFRRLNLPGSTNLMPIFLNFARSRAKPRKYLSGSLLISAEIWSLIA
jgi:hypothetical protein